MLPIDVRTYVKYFMNHEHITQNAFQKGKVQNSYADSGFYPPLLNTFIDNYAHADTISEEERKMIHNRAGVLVDIAHQTGYVRHGYVNMLFGNFIAEQRNNLSPEAAYQTAKDEMNGEETFDHGPVGGWNCVVLTHPEVRQVLVESAKNKRDKEEAAQRVRKLNVNQRIAEALVINVKLKDALYAQFEVDENRAGMNTSCKYTNANTLKKVLKVMEPDGRHFN